MASEWMLNLPTLNDARGVPFKDFVNSTRDELSEMLQFSFKAQPENAALKDADNSKTSAYLARASYLHAKARGYAMKARGVICFGLIGDGHKATVVNDLSKAHLADFEEEALVWEALVDSLHERLWTGRGEMRRLNRGEG